MVQALVVRMRSLILLVVVAAGGFGFFWWRAHRVVPVAVILHTVGRGTVETIVANTRGGTIEAIRRAKIAPQTGGQVDKLPVRRGSRVVEGQVLLELWNEDLKAQIALAKSEQIRAKAYVEQIRWMSEVAERDSKRMLELRLTEISSEEQTLRMVAEANAKKSELAAAEASLIVAGDKLRTAEASLMRTVLKAPFSGIVAEVNAELGEYVTPSPPGIPTLPAIDLIDTESLYVRAPIDEVDASAVKVGMPARITLDSIRGRSFAGKVSRVAPYVLDREKEARTVDVEVEFANAHEMRLVLPGASADVEVVVDTVADALRLPTEAILPGKTVLVWQAEDHRLVARKIETGLGSFTFTEVKSGLSDGEQVVVSLDRPGVVAGAVATPESNAAPAGTESSKR